MKIRTANLLLWFALTALAGLLSGCASTDPDNASVRPWSAPASWENGLGGMDNQHN
jgi:type IV pilus biogenesis protein CpaD/CtpE